MTILVNPPKAEDRLKWESLYHGYAEFYKAPMNKEIRETVWFWIQDETYPFFGLLAKINRAMPLAFQWYQ